jgi:hypothetical protein
MTARSTAPIGESGIVYQSFSWTIGRVYDEFPEAASRWEALGQQDSDIHWAYGREADALIARGVPNMLAYSAIGRKAGRGSQTIRKAYYTYMAFPDAMREQYHLVPYSVFRHARSCDNPDAVLEYYITENGKHGCGVDEIEAVFPLTETDEARESFAASKFPRYLYGAWRQMIGLNGTRTEAEYHLNEFVRLVEER